MKKIFYLILIFTANCIVAQKTITAQIYIYDDMHYQKKINYQLINNNSDSIPVINNQIKIKVKSISDESIVINGNYVINDNYKELIDIKLINIPLSETINVSPIYFFTKNFIPNGSCIEVRVKKYLFGLIKIKKKIDVFCPEQMGSFNKLQDKEKNIITFLDINNKEIKYPVENNQIIIDCKKLIIK